MRFINADLWWLALLALLPLLIYLLIRRRLPRVHWAAMTFLLRALQKNRKRLLLETILLLVVRTAIVIAMVLVVLRPVARSAWGWLTSDRQPVLSVVVLDDSASMAASDGVSTRLARARNRIEQYLDELPGGSRVAVVLAGQPPTAPIRQPTRDLGYVRQTLSKLTARDSQGAIGRALELAGQILSNETTPNRQVFIATDAQETDWHRDSASITTALGGVLKSTAVFMSATPATPAQNVTVTRISLSGGPQSLVPGLATTLWPTTITVHLAPVQHSDPVETIVELFVENRKVARRPITLPLNQESVVTFEHRFNTPGEHAITARTEPDLFDRDDARSMVATVHERIPVLMIDGRPAMEPFESATGFLRVALWPIAPDDAGAQSLFDVQVTPAAALDSVDVSRFPLMVMADVAALPGHLLGQIKSAVRAGAGLLVIAGPQVTGASLTAMLADNGQGPLPIEPAAAIDLPEDAQPVGLTLSTPLVPALAGFEDPTLTSELSRVGWRIVRPVSGGQGENLQTWAHFTRGGAALVANRYGNGLVIYFGATADRRGSDFPLSPAFVPFFQQLAFYLLRDVQTAEIVAGQPLSWPTQAVGGAIVSPDGTSEPADLRVVEDRDTNRSRVLLPAADRAGIYALQHTRKDGQRERLLKAVAVPAEESNTTTLDAMALREAPALKSARVIQPDESPRDALRSARGRAELSGPGLLLLAALLLTELMLIRIFTPRPVDAQALLRHAMDT
ncbi:MAG: hypothetical protein AMXMBFR13_27290 [Phycisphaerae bacterium]